MSRIIELLGTRCYSEGGEETVDAAVRNHELDEEELLDHLGTTWPQWFRLWLHRRRRRAAPEEESSSDCEDIVSAATIQNSSASSSIETLQEILTMLQAEESEENDEEDDLVLSLVRNSTEQEASSNNRGSSKNDPLVRFWSQHQRYFVLRDLKEIWERLSAAEQSLLRTILPLMDRIISGSTSRTGTSSKKELPAWMTVATAAVAEALPQQSTPSQICRSYWCEQKKKSLAGSSVGIGGGRISAGKDSMTRKTNTNNAPPASDRFLSWIRSRLPLDAERKQAESFCEQLGREGSRGTLSRRIEQKIWKATTTAAINGNDVMSIRASLQRSLLDVKVTNETTRRGKALLHAFLETLSCLKDPTTTAPAAVALDFSRRPVAKTVECYLQQQATEASLNLHILVQTLWRKAVASSIGSIGRQSTATTTTTEHQRDEIVEAFRVHADWLPFSSLFRCCRSFLLSSLTTSIREDDSVPALQELQQAKTMSDILSAWIGDSRDWYLVWWSWIDNCEPLIEASFHLFHSYSCLLESFDEATTGPLDCPAILHSCAIFVTVLESTADAAKNTKVSADHLLGSSSSSSFRMGAILTLFRDIQRSLTGIPDEPCRLAADELRGRFHGLCQSLQQPYSSCSDVSLQEYLRTAIEFCYTLVSQLSAPEWCRNTTNRAKQLLDSHQCLGTVWILELVRCQKLGTRATCEWPPLLKLLHHEMVRHAWSSPQPQSLVQQLVLVPSGENGDRPILDSILLSSLPTHTFRVHPAGLGGALESALQQFGESATTTAHVFLGVALRLESLLSQTTGSSNGVRSSCFQLARKFLLGKRCGQGWQEASTLYHDWIPAKLVLEGAALGREWWKEVCFDLFDPSPRSPSDANAATVQTVAAVESFGQLVSILEDVLGVGATDRKRPVGVVQSSHHQHRTMKKQRSSLSSSAACATTSARRPHRGIQRRSAPPVQVLTKIEPTADIDSIHVGRETSKEKNDAATSESEDDSFDEDQEDEILLLDA